MSRRFYPKILCLYIVLGSKPDPDHDPDHDPDPEVLDPDPDPDPNISPLIDTIGRREIRPHRRPTITEYQLSSNKVTGKSPE